MFVLNEGRISLSLEAPAEKTVRVSRVKRIPGRAFFFFSHTCFFEAERVIVPRRSLNAGGLCEYGTRVVSYVLFCRCDRWSSVAVAMGNDNGFGSLEKTADLLLASLSVEALIRRFKKEQQQQQKKWIKINARVVLVRAPARLSLSDASL